MSLYPRLGRGVVDVDAESDPDLPAVVPLRLQPEPIECRISALPFPGGRQAVATARLWVLGDTHKCRRCEACTASHERGFCLVMTDEPIPVSVSAIPESAG